MQINPGQILEQVDGFLIDLDGVFYIGNQSIKGAAGMKGILVKTGKYREELVKKSTVKPDVVVEGIRELHKTTNSKSKF